MKVAISKGVWLLPLLLLFAALYFFVDPGESVYMPKCIFKTVTGLDCPGCGSQRALHALLHGDFLEALRMNALLVVLLPLLGWMLWLESVRKSRPKLYAGFYRRWVVLTIGGTVAAWFIVRNILSL